MAVSGSTLWELNRNEIITAAYRKIGIPGEGNTLSSAQISDGAEALNAIINLAVTDGMPLWKRLEATLVPNNILQEYTIPSAIKVPDIFLRDTSSGTQYKLQHKSLYDFHQLPRTTSPSVPVAYYAQPTISGYKIGIWPLYSDDDTILNKRMIAVYQDEFDSFTNSDQTLDFPAYWTQAIIYQTAVSLASENGVPIEDRKMLMLEAKSAWDKASAYGDEEGSLFITPDYWGRHG
jgi:hypothetical protein